MAVQVRVRETDIRDPLDVWHERYTSAASAALTLQMEAAGSDVHEDFRPGRCEVEWARDEMARWMAAARNPLPDDGAQFVV
ncbi:MAG: hypothetical protein E6J41_17355 [Chloroflexi bacterium]|nr:MAG: hypothetical protein E6J41_17355 [Chloroflexota bacterium]